MQNDQSLKGLGLFSLEVLHLISIGEKETFKEIEKHFEECDTIEYIYNKYKNEFSVHFDNQIYNNAALNKYFFNYTSYVEGNERRKYKLANEDDGLLLIIALVFDALELYSPNMKVE